MANMLEKLQKMKEKHGMPEVSGKDREAKMNVVEALRHAMEQEMGKGVKGGIDGMKKVSVMSDSQEGLQHGLDTAKQVLEHNGFPADHGGEHGMKEAEDMDAEHDPEMHHNDGDMEDSEQASDEYESPEHHESEYEDHDMVGNSPAEHDEDEDMDDGALDEKLKKLMSMKSKRGMKS